MYSIMSATGFAAGGMVTPVRLGDPTAGKGGTRSTLNLTIDGNKFEGLHAPAHVATQLTTYAIGRRTVSGGKQPSWIGGGR